MIRVNRCAALMAVIGAVMLCDRPARAGDWTSAVEVRHDETLSISYQAKLDGPNLVVRATIEPGWHTFPAQRQQNSEGEGPAPLQVALKEGGNAHLEGDTKATPLRWYSDEGFQMKVAQLQDQAWLEVFLRPIPRRLSKVLLLPRSAVEP